MEIRIGLLQVFLAIGTALVFLDGYLDVRKLGCKTVGCRGCCCDVRLRMYWM